MRIGLHEVEISHRDKIFFPDAHRTKGDLVDHYLDVAEVMVPLVRGRPVSMERLPDGLEGTRFFQRDTPDHFPAWIATVTVPRREGGTFRAACIEDAATLAYMANQGMVTPHVHLSRADDLERPDRLVFDLDPPGDDPDDARTRVAALDLRDVLEELDLRSWVQTTGSRGFHVVVPIQIDLAFDEVRHFARDVARILAKRDDARYTVAQRKAQRGDRIYVDVMRNAYAATVVAPYAVRALPDAPVATPLHWHEVERGAGPRDWKIGDLARRLGQTQDPWQDMARHARSLRSRRERLDALSD